MFRVYEHTFTNTFHFPDGEKELFSSESFFDCYCFWNKIDKSSIKPNSQIDIMEDGHGLIIKSKTKDYDKE